MDLDGWMNAYPGSPFHLFRFVASPISTPTHALETEQGMRVTEVDASLLLLWQPTHTYPTTVPESHILS